MQLVALEMRYQISIKLTGSATGTHSEKESGPVEGECLEKVGIVWPLESTGDWRCYWSCYSS